VDSILGDKSVVKEGFRRYPFVESGKRRRRRSMVSILEDQSAENFLGNNPRYLPPVTVNGEGWRWKFPETVHGR